MMIEKLVRVHPNLFLAIVMLTFCFSNSSFAHSLCSVPGEDAQGKGSKYLVGETVEEQGADYDHWYGPNSEVSKDWLIDPLERLGLPIGVPLFQMISCFPSLRIPYQLGETSTQVIASAFESKINYDLFHGKFSVSGGDGKPHFRVKLSEGDLYFRAIYNSDSFAGKRADGKDPASVQTNGDDVEMVNEYSTEDYELSQSNLNAAAGLNFFMNRFYDKDPSFFGDLWAKISGNYNDLLRQSGVYFLSYEPFNSVSEIPAAPSAPNTWDGKKTVFSPSLGRDMDLSKRANIFMVPKGGIDKFQIRPDHMDKLHALCEIKAKDWTKTDDAAQWENPAEKEPLILLINEDQQFERQSFSEVNCFGEDLETGVCARGFLDEPMTVKDEDGNPVPRGSVPDGEARTILAKNLHMELDYRGYSPPTGAVHAVQVLGCFPADKLKHAAIYLPSLSEGGTDQPNENDLSTESFTNDQWVYILKGPSQIYTDHNTKEVMRKLEKAPELGSKLGDLTSMDTFKDLLAGFFNENQKEFSKPSTLEWGDHGFAYASGHYLQLHMHHVGPESDLAWDANVFQIKQVVPNMPDPDLRGGMLAFTPNTNGWAGTPPTSCYVAYNHRLLDGITQIEADQEIQCRGQPKCDAASGCDDLTSLFRLAPGQSAQIPPGEVIKDLTIARNAVFALGTSGILYAQGGFDQFNALPADPVMSGVKGVEKLAMGNHCTCSLLSDQSLHCWGNISGSDLGCSNSDSKIVSEGNAYSQLFMGPETTCVGSAPASDSTPSGSPSAVTPTASTTTLSCDSNRFYKRNQIRDAFNKWIGQFNVRGLDYVPSAFPASSGGPIVERVFLGSAFACMIADTGGISCQQYNYKNGKQSGPPPYLSDPRQMPDPIFNFSGAFNSSARSATNDPFFYLPEGWKVEDAGGGDDAFGICLSLRRWTKIGPERKVACYGSLAESVLAGAAGLDLSTSK